MGAPTTRTTLIDIHAAFTGYGSYQINTRDEGRIDYAVELTSRQSIVTTTVPERTRRRFVIDPERARAFGQKLAGVALVAIVVGGWYFLQSQKSL